MSMKKLFFCCFLSIMMYSSELLAETMWQHPGVLLNQAQLDFITQQVNAKVEPFYSEYQKAIKSPYGSKTYAPKGPYSTGVTQCGSYSSPDNGCSAAHSDTAAAYLQAVLWYISGDKVYADNAIAIMNAYGKNLKGFAGYTSGYPCPGAGSTCSNGPLQAAWDSDKWPRAAEIIRYGHNGSARWSPADIAAFSVMLKNVYEPVIYNGSAFNGNWEISMIEGMMGIAVFNEDEGLWRHAQSFWQERVPAYFYNFSADNPFYPNDHAPFPQGRETSSKWNDQLIFNADTDGVTQETCRDLKHAEYGLASAINAAETDYIQGGSLTANLYTANNAQSRLVTAMNVMAGLESKASTVAPPSFCTGAKGKLTLGLGSTYVVGYNEYHNRLKDPNMADGGGSSGLRGTANTYNWIQNGNLPQDRYSDYGAHMVIFEALTHYASGAINPAFTMDVSPKSQNVDAGAIASFNVNIASVGGYTGSVKLQLTNALPKDVMSTFIPAQIEGGKGSSVLKISTTQATLTGTYDLEVVGVDNALKNSVKATLTVVSADKLITISANNSSMAKGDNVPSLTYKVAPAITLTKAPTCITSATSKSDVGVYPINCTGAVKEGYTFTYLSGQMDVTPAGSIITIKARDEKMDYTTPLPEFRYKISPAVSLTVEPTCRTSATSNSLPGIYPISCSGAVKQGFSFIYMNASLTISPLDLRVRADNRRINKGDVIPLLTYRLSVPDAKLSVYPVCITTATSSSPVGSYPITCSGASGEGYMLSYTPGELKIR